MAIIFLSLGSNISPRSRHIFQSIEILRSTYPHSFKVSPVYETKPFLKSKGMLFLNCCLSFTTEQSAAELLCATKRIEKDLGRRRTGKKWEDRIIDIDLIFYDELIIKSELITIPHYDLSQRDFFLIPLLDLNQNLINPQSGKLIKDELKNIPESKRTHPVLYNKNTTRI